MGMGFELELKATRLDAGDEERSQNLCLAVEGNAVCFKYGKYTVLEELNISVERGVIYGLLGPSGCGKTTLLRCIVGRHKPSGGSIKIYGKTPGQTGFCVPGPGVGFMPQELALYHEITTEETLTYFGRVYQMSQKDINERITFLTEFLNIPDKKKLIRNLSGGQQRRVSFAAALIHKPPLIILDEPTVGVDPLLRKSIWDYLQSLATVDFITIIVTTHYVEEARKAHVVGLMRNGRLLAEANPECLIQKYGVGTLEDVFLRLCAKEKKASEAKEDGNSAEEQQEMNYAESQEEIWVLREQDHCKYLPLMEGNSSEQKAGLLNNTADSESMLNPKSSVISMIQASATRLGAVTAKNFIRLKRNIPLLFFHIFVPVIQVILICICIGGDPFDLSLAVVNMEEDPSGKSNLFLESINSQTISLVPYANLTPAIDSVKRGENWGVLYIKPTFTDSLINRYLDLLYVDNETIQDSTIMLYLDMTNHQISITIHTKVMEAFQVFAETMLRNTYQNPLLAQPPLVLGQPIYGHEKPNFIEYMAPGMVAGIMYIMDVGLSSMSIIIEKKEGLLDRSWIAGVKYWEVMFAILFPLFVVMLFQMALVIALTFLALNISCLGPLVWVIIAVLLVGLEGMAFGVFISSVCNDENTAVMLTLGSFYPNILLSGIIWPVEAMPYYLKQLSNVLPLTLIANTMRCIISRGWDITENGIWSGYVVALAWIVPVILISTLIFRYKQ